MIPPFLHSHALSFILKLSYLRLSSYLRRVWFVSAAKRRDEVACDWSSLYCTLHFLKGRHLSVNSLLLLNCCMHRRFRIHCPTYTITLLHSELYKDNLGFFPWLLSFALVIVFWCFCLVPSQLLSFFFTTLSTCLLVYLPACQRPSTCLPVCLSSCPTNVYP